MTRPTRKLISDLEVCKACNLRDTENLGSIITILKVQLNLPEKLCASACERSVDKGYIDFGVSLGYAWLTDKGRALLENE